MQLDRRSFRVGVIAGVFLLAGIITGVIFTARSGWMSEAQSAPPTATVLPAGTVPEGFAPVAKIAMPAVVNISTTRVIKQQPMQASPFPDDPMFRQFFGDEFFRHFQVPRERRENSLGSGVIVSSDGYIVTNAHVVDKADKIRVLLPDKREFTGKVIGSDRKTDVAVVKIDAKDLPTIAWGDSDKAEVGQYVLAIGNPFGLNSTVTLGIVSALGRANMGIEDYENFIQTDAAINPGNSGGALVNTRGELIGINTAIFSRTGGYMGIGFAIPSNMVKEVMTSLIKHGRVIRGYLGVSIQDVNEKIAKQFGMKEPSGALVSDVVSGSPAAAGGLQAGDVITSFDGMKVENSLGLRNRVADTPVGKTVKVEVLRNKKTVTLNVKIAEQPKNMMASESVKGSATSGALAGLDVRTLTRDDADQLNLSPGTEGVVITAVASGSPADEAGIQPGDVIVQLNHKTVRNVEDYRRIAKSIGKNDAALLLVVRQGSRIFVVINP
jgi:serine protease Do